MLTSRTFTFCTKLFCTPFMCLHFGFVIFWQKEIGTKTALRNDFNVKISPSICSQFHLYFKYLPEKSVAIMMVCSEPDVIVELNRKTTMQKAIAYHGKYVFFKDVCRELKELLTPTSTLVIMMWHTHIGLSFCFAPPCRGEERRLEMKF